MLEPKNKLVAPGFDTPLELLRACHARISDQCTTLRKLLQHLKNHSCDVQAQQAAQAILRYFDTAGKLHHQDEEMDLFPHLLASGDAEARELVYRLRNEHRSMDEVWLFLRQQLVDISKGVSATLDPNTVARFSLEYGNHITLENMQLLPLSAQLLSKQQLAELGEKMASRRRVTLPFN